MMPLVQLGAPSGPLQSDLSLQPMYPEPTAQADHVAGAPVTAEPQPLQVEVTVRESVSAGQQITFTTPTGQQMMVPVTEHYPAGTVLTVQCPSRSWTPHSHYMPQPLAEQAVHAAAGNHQFVDPGPLLQLPAVSFEREDKQWSLSGWILYALGWVSFCCSPVVVGLVLWIIVASMFYCKPRERRVRLPKQKKTARAALWTSAALVLCVLLIACRVVWIHHGNFGEQKHFRSMAHPAAP
uniref:Uncharacterized protein n=1 Tax=Noctiluca scintillans TaxID=2966 RepID=A0A7S1FJY1_NOCSC|mmetsp:Transcript_7032/g.19332  ORF Transcript_7032/g.19332 Transcript_7032/m.19332 type:complete len:238 (+) Transcript_7032:71-784(+)